MAIYSGISVAQETLCQLIKTVSPYSIYTYKNAKKVGYYFPLCENSSRFALKKGGHFPFTPDFEADSDSGIPRFIDILQTRYDIFITKDDENRTG